MSKKLALALGAGGSRGVAHVGVLRALEEEGIKPDFITGSSMGSVVGACYAMGMSCDEMLNTVLKLKAIQLLDPTAVPLSRQGLLKGNKMHKLLLSKIGDRNFEDLNIPFRCVASDLYSGRSVTLSSGNLSDAVRASSSIPVLFHPVQLDGRLLVDGGVLCRVPTEQAWEMGAEAVIAVDVLSNTGESVKSVKNVVSVVFRVYDMMDYNATKMKKELYGRENELWLVPEMKGMSQYAVKDMDKAYAAGYHTAKANMQAIKELIK